MKAVLAVVLCWLAVSTARDVDLVEDIEARLSLTDSEKEPATSLVDQLEETLQSVGDEVEEKLENEDRAPDEVDNPVIVDSDILLSKEHAAIYYKSGWNGLINTQAWERNTRRWPSRIPFAISREIKGLVLENLINSLREIQARTCIKFYARRKKVDNTYLYFRRSRRQYMGKDSFRNCYTYFGKPVRGRRSVYLGPICAGRGKERTPAHEVMHAMGRHHEQQRPDRNNYVTINDNTCPKQMRKLSNASTLAIGYDYYSIMHYSPSYCSWSDRQPSMSFPRGVDLDRVGQRDRLSLRDVQHLRAIHCPSMMMRLVDGEGPYDGRVEVHNNFVWGTVCSVGFDETDAAVICRYLGHPGVEEVYNDTSNDTLSDRVKPIWMSNLMCTGSEHNPFDCVQAPMGTHDCNHEQDVSIRCSMAGRLVDGHMENSGRLEVYNEGNWGSVCSHGFRYHEAKVACRMMGYSRPLRAFTVHGTNSTTDVLPVILSQVKCDGSETNLFFCEHDVLGCSDGKEVHLECGHE